MNTPFYTYRVDLKELPDQGLSTALLYYGNEIPSLCTIIYFILLTLLHSIAYAWLPGSQLLPERKELGTMHRLLNAKRLMEFIFVVGEVSHIH